jgi:hypothetical protein
LEWGFSNFYASCVFLEYRNTLSYPPVAFFCRNRTTLPVKVTLGNLSGEVLDILIGCMIGDATCTQRGSNSHMKISHSTKQIGYAQWKLDILKNYVVSGRKLSYLENFKSVKSGSSWYSGVEFTTLGSSSITELKKLFSQNPFYLNSKKSIPNNIGEYINARVFAVILGDDGKTKHSSNYYELCLQSFSPNELNILNTAINEKLGLYGRVVPHEKQGRFIIRYPVSDNLLIGNIISTYLPTCMHFKILRTDPRHIPVAVGAGLPLPLRGDQSAWRVWYQSTKLLSTEKTMGFAAWLESKYGADGLSKKDRAYYYDVKSNTIDLEGIRLSNLPGESSAS